MTDLEGKWLIWRELLGYLTFVRQNDRERVRQFTYQVRSYPSGATMMHSSPRKLPKGWVLPWPPAPWKWKTTGTFWPAEVAGMATLAVLTYSQYIDKLGPTSQPCLSGSTYIILMWLQWKPFWSPEMSGLDQTFAKINYFCKDKLLLQR